jgi:multisubunit Na+/H+ antiporter MnhB subunit
MMFERSWYYRRIAFFAILVVGLALLSYVVVFGVDDALRRDSLSTLMLIIMGAFGVYMTGSVMDDRFKGKEMIAQSAVDQATPSTSETSVEIKQ